MKNEKPTVGVTIALFCQEFDYSTIVNLVVHSFHDIPILLQSPELGINHLIVERVVWSHNVAIQSGKEGHEKFKVFKETLEKKFGVKMHYRCTDDIRTAHV